MNNTLICYGISKACLQGGGASMGGMPVDKNLSPSLIASGCNGVVYAIENHPQDSRASISEDGVVQTLPARMGTGRGNVPLVLIVSESPANQEQTR